MLWRALGTLVLAALMAVPAHARGPFGRGVLLRGTVVSMDPGFRVIRHGNVLVRGHRIAAVWRGRTPPKRVRTGQAIVVAPRGAMIFPGLINLHDHPGWSVLPPWPPPSSDAQPAFGRPLGTEPYANRYQWNGNNGFDDVSPEHVRLVSAPHDALRALNTEAVKWAEIRGLLGGQTSEQGAGPDPATDDSLARNVDNVNFGRDRVETNTFPAADPALVARERAGTIDAFIAHVAEGVRDGERRPGDTYSSRSEFTALQRDHLLNDEAVIVHGTALERADFAPSGSANLLEELKVADITLRSPALLGQSRGLVARLRSDRALDRELVAMVTRNPARALRWYSRVGAVTAGRLADLMVVTPPRRDSVYRGLIDASDRDVQLTLVGGEPLAGDPALMRRLKGADLATAGGRAIDVTKPGVPGGMETFAAIQGALRNGLEQMGIQLSPILPEDDAFRFRVIEGTAGAEPYPSNLNQGMAFAGFEARWYSR